MIDLLNRPRIDERGNISIALPLDLTDVFEAALREAHLRAKCKRLGMPYIGGGAAPSAWTFYNNFHLYVADPTFNLTSGTQSFYVALFLSTSNFATVTNTLYGDLTNEVANANGYTTGGVALSGQTWTIATATAQFTTSPASFTASGGSIVARAAVIYLNATSNGHVKPLLCYSLLDSAPADVTVSALNTLTLTMNASGIFTLAG